MDGEVGSPVSTQHAPYTKCQTAQLKKNCRDTSNAARHDGGVAAYQPSGIAVGTQGGRADNTRALDSLQVETHLQVETQNARPPLVIFRQWPLAEAKKKMMK